MNLLAEIAEMKTKLEKLAVAIEKMTKEISGNKKIKIEGVYQEKIYTLKINLLEELQEAEYEYLARDESGVLYAYAIEPEKKNYVWGAYCDDCEIIENDNFPEIKWTDGEPTKISDLLASYENGGENGNNVKDTEQAITRSEKIKVEEELKKFSSPFKYEQNNYFIQLCWFDKTISLDADGDFQSQGTIYFSSEKKALEAISSVGVERIKKYFFEVGD